MTYNVFSGTLNPAQSIDNDDDSDLAAPGDGGEWLGVVCGVT